MDENDFATPQDSQAVETLGYAFTRILVLAKIHELPHSTEACKQRIEWFTKCHEHRELDGNDGEPVEFEWKLSQDTQHGSYFRKSKECWKSTTFCLNTSKIESIFMSMYNDIDWTKHGNTQMCISNSSEVEAYARRFPQGYWLFFGPGTAEKWYGMHTTYKPNGLWNNSAEVMMHLREVVIIISVNQLSVYGAILDWCAELAQQISDHSFSSTA